MQVGRFDVVVLFIMLQVVFAVVFCCSRGNVDSQNVVEVVVSAVGIGSCCGVAVVVGCGVDVVVGCGVDVVVGCGVDVVVGCGVDVVGCGVDVVVG